ncbi:MAG: hypothetical protein AABY22_29350 [Nanoarchaeota archaeon]
MEFEYKKYKNSKNNNFKVIITFNNLFRGTDNRNKLLLHIINAENKYSGNIITVPTHEDILNITEASLFVEEHNERYKNFILNQDTKHFLLKKLKEITSKFKNE